MPVWGSYLQPTGGRPNTGEDGTCGCCLRDFDVAFFTTHHNPHCFREGQRAARQTTTIPDAAIYFLRFSDVVFRESPCIWLKPASCVLCARTAGWGQRKNPWAFLHMRYSVHTTPKNRSAVCLVTEKREIDNKYTCRLDSYRAPACSSHASIPVRKTRGFRKT